MERTRGEKKETVRSSRKYKWGAPFKTLWLARNPRKKKKRGRRILQPKRQGPSRFRQGARWDGRLRNWNEKENLSARKKLVLALREGRIRLLLGSGGGLRKTEKQLGV